MTQPRAWEYETGAKAYRLSAQGRLNLKGRDWEITRALAGPGLWL
ncbi:MAG TPA: hypothetical protein VMI32_16265 [Candidatus Solibacter sp.]|nr:hypothetical protein [Candidatus Solibacter sp.]